MDTKLKADIAESAVTTELLKRGFRVLRPVGDRLPYDFAIDDNGGIKRIQVKHAWFDSKKKIFFVDSRRTKTNRRKIKHDPYSVHDFDFAVIYIDKGPIFYIMPSLIFNSYGSTIGIVESIKRQRKPRAAQYRERWDLLSNNTVI